MSSLGNSTTPASVAMAIAIHSQNPIGSSPTSTCEWLHHNTNKRQILLISALIFHFILVVFFCPLPPQSTSCMELYWPDVVCPDTSCANGGSAFPPILWFHFCNIYTLALVYKRLIGRNTLKGRSGLPQLGRQEDRSSYHHECIPPTLKTFIRTLLKSTVQNPMGCYPSP